MAARLVKKWWMRLTGPHRATLGVCAVTVAAAAASGLPPGVGGPAAAVDTRDTADEPAIVQELTSRSATVYRDPDGTYRLVAYNGRVNYRDEEGDWQPIDNELVPAPGETYAVENEANAYNVGLPQDAGANPVRFEAGGEWVTFKMDGLDGSPVVEGTEATYTQAGDASEVVYEARANGVKESIVLDEAPADAVEFTFDLGLSAGLRPVLRTTGEIEIMDASGDRAFTMPAPFMVDSASPEPAVSTDVSYELQQVPTGWQLVVAPATHWLQDQARVYPVVVDPTISESPSVNDGWIVESNPDSTNSGGNNLRVGGPSNAQRRGLVRFSLSQVPSNAAVESATLKLYLNADLTTGSGTSEYIARRVTESWDNALTWNRRVAGTGGLWSTPGGVWANSSWPGITMSGATAGYKSFDVTPMVEGWIKNGLPNNGLIVKKVNDGTDKLLWFYSNNADDPGNMPTLEVTFNLYDDDGLSTEPAGEDEDLSDPWAPKPLPSVYDGPHGME